jgi:hypothetical protein
VISAGCVNEQVHRPAVAGEAVQDADGTIGHGLERQIVVVPALQADLPHLMRCREAIPGDRRTDVQLRLEQVGAADVARGHPVHDAAAHRSVDAAALAVLDDTELLHPVIASVVVERLNRCVSRDQVVARHDDSSEVERVEPVRS